MKTNPMQFPIHQEICSTLNTHPQKQYKMPLTSKFIPQGVHNISNKELLEFTHKSEDKKPEWIPY